MMFDIVIRGGMLVDGTGAAARRADIAIADGRIVAVGEALGDARHSIDAAGRIVAPGFIDPHTHFDVQLLWDGAARPALAHGVTTVVPGNCSLSLAPLKAADRKRVVGMFQQIEEMPPEAFTQAFDWTWEDFAGYRDAIAKNLSVNVAPLVGHSLIRLWVMGPASQERAAMPAEIAAMQDLLRQSLEAGAVGLSTSFVDVDENARPVPSRFAQFDELDALCAVLGEFGRMLQVVPEFYDPDLTIARVDQLSALSLKHNIPTTFSPLFDSAQAPDNVSKVMARVAEQFARGARVWPQVQTRPIDISFSFLRPSLYFARLPRWMRILRLAVPERLAALRDADTVAKMVGDADTTYMSRGMANLIVRGGDNAPADYAGRTLGELAKARGESVALALINISLEGELDVAFLSASQGHNVTERVGALLAHPLVHVGASDGGAHLTSFATYGDTGFLFSEFVRGSGHLTLEQAVKKITADTAEIWGLKNRGRIAPGYAADIVVFDAGTIARGEERPIFDMPGDGMRYTRDAVGVDTVLVNGAVAYANGAYTSAKTGLVCT